MEETLNKIEKIIAWWKSLQKGYNDIDMLLYKEQRLSGYSYYLAEILADSEEDALIAYFWRKINSGKSKNSFISEGKSAAAAESLSVIETEEELLKEVNAKSVSFKANILLRQVNKVLDAIRTRISYLKSEKPRPVYEDNIRTTKN